MLDEKKIMAETFLSYDSISLLKERLSQINDSEILHLILLGYNWDDGLEIPQIIMDNQFCELGTALEMFYLAEGLDYLENKEQCEYIEDIEWITFVKKLYFSIIQGEFSKGCIEFSPPLSKVQIFKLKKKIREDEMVFIQPIENVE